VSEVHGEGNVNVYSDVCLRYRVREMLLCTVMCVFGTGWGNITLNLSELIYDICCIFLLRCFGIRYKYSLFYTLQPCELHNSRQCH